MPAGMALAEELARQAFNLDAPEALNFLIVPDALLTLPRLARA
jgi:hypothetical protein